jgi:hypothetical protein
LLSAPTLSLPAFSLETSMPPLFALGYKEAFFSHIAQDTLPGYLLAKTLE